MWSRNNFHNCLDNFLFIHKNGRIQPETKLTQKPTISPTNTPILTNTPIFTITPEIIPTSTPPSQEEIKFMLSDNTNLILKCIVPVPFVMGSLTDEPERGADETPHEVIIENTFYIAQCEITNLQFRCFRSEHFSGDYYNDDRQPVIHVTWNDAVEFCEWLSSKLNGRFRLPTEAEWEYACRSGTKTRRYWGDDLDGQQTCNFANVADQSYKKMMPAADVFLCDDGYMRTSPVGSFAPNKFDLYDMQGNVWEWCMDCYGKYPTIVQKNPQVPNIGDSRVLRGGGFTGASSDIRSAKRFAKPPTYHQTSVGFRVVYCP